MEMPLKTSAMDRSRWSNGAFHRKVDYYPLIYSNEVL